jgi:dTDP-glucose 4,6-dehydratase
LCDLPHHHDRQYYRCDIREYRQLERIFEKQTFDYVYNLAAEFGRWNGEDYYENLWMTNVVGTKHLIRLQEKLKFKLIHFSSSEVYGDYEGIMKEDVTDTVEIKQMNDYAMTKWVNEMQIRNSKLVHQTETVIVRLFNTYGPGEYYSPYRSAVCLFAYRALHNIPFTVYLNHIRTSTYLEDCVRALANICENFKAGETYNIGGKTEHDMKTVAELIIRYTGVDPNLVTYKESEAMTTKVKRTDISKAERDLNLKETVSLDQGIQNTIQWMKSIYPQEKI